MRKLKDNLSRCLRRIEAGERTAVSADVIRAAIEDGDPLEDWPDIRLPRGTAAALIDSDRGEA